MDKPNPLQLHVYDFDGTLFRSPPRPPWWRGRWWTRADSLSPPCLPAVPGPEYWVADTVGRARASIANPDVFAVMMTGRRGDVFQARLAQLLGQQGLQFDLVLMAPGDVPVGEWKVEQLNALMQRFRRARGVSLWEDNEENLLALVTQVEAAGRACFPHVTVTYARPPLCGAAPSAPSAARVAARYKEKKKVPSEDGGETTVYVYSERQIANRHREKAERVEHLRKNIDKLRTRVTRDLGSDDEHEQKVALAVALMDATCERVGNHDSADDGHYGVTGWTGEHVSFKGDKAVICYTGKSGVDHEKIVDDPKLVKHLKRLKEKGEDRLLEGVDPEDVNAYLKEFDVTAKDLRGYRANQEMLDALKAERAKGPAELPRPRKERDKILKAEFLAALEVAAEVVGHESSTLRSQYLVPSLEDAYMADGTVLKSLTGKKAAEALPPPDAAAYVEGFHARHPQFARYRGVPVRSVTSPGAGSHPEARLGPRGVELFPRFWLLVDEDARDYVFAHELGHWVLDRYGMAPFVQLADSFGVDVWDRGELPYAAINFDEAFADAFAEWNLNRADLKRRYPSWAQVVAAVVGGAKTATKTHAELEDEAVAETVRPKPKKKPPRKDLRDNSLDLGEDDDSEDDRDLSLNYKRVAATRVARMHLLAARVAARAAPDNAMAPRVTAPSAIAPLPSTAPKKHGPGDVWKTDDGGWRANNKDGVAKSFADKDKAEQYAQAEGEGEGEGKAPKPPADKAPAAPEGPQEAAPAAAPKLDPQEHAELRSKTNEAFKTYMKGGSVFDANSIKELGEGLAQVYRAVDPALKAGLHKAMHAATQEVLLDVGDHLGSGDYGKALEALKMGDPADPQPFDPKKSAAVLKQLVDAKGKAEAAVAKLEKTIADSGKKRKTDQAKRDKLPADIQAQDEKIEEAEAEAKKIQGNIETLKAGLEAGPDEADAEAIRATLAINEKALKENLQDAAKASSQKEKLEGDLASIEESLASADERAKQAEKELSSARADALEAGRDMMVGVARHYAATAVLSMVTNPDASIPNAGQDPTEVQVDAHRKGALKRYRSLPAPLATKRLAKAEAELQSLDREEPSAPEGGPYRGEPKVPADTAARRRYLQAEVQAGKLAAVLAGDDKKDGEFTESVVRKLHGLHGATPQVYALARGPKDPAYRSALHEATTNLGDAELVEALGSHVPKRVREMAKLLEEGKTDDGEPLDKHTIHMLRQTLINATLNDQGAAGSLGDSDSEPAAPGARGPAKKNRPSTKAPEHGGVLDGLGGDYKPGEMSMEDIFKFDRSESRGRNDSSQSSGESSGRSPMVSRFGTAGRARA